MIHEVPNEKFNFIKPTSNCCLVLVCKAWNHSSVFIHLCFDVWTTRALTACVVTSWDPSIVDESEGDGSCSGNQSVWLLNDTCWTPLTPLWGDTAQLQQPWSGQNTRLSVCCQKIKIIRNMISAISLLSGQTMTDHYTQSRPQLYLRPCSHYNPNPIIVLSGLYLDW